MPVIPWTTPKLPPPHDGSVTVMTSRLELRRLRNVPRSWRLRIRRQTLGSPGALGVSLIRLVGAPDVLDPVGLAGPGSAVSGGRPPAAPADHDPVPAADGELWLRQLDRPGYGPAYPLGRCTAPPRRLRHRTQARPERPRCHRGRHAGQQKGRIMTGPDPAADDMIGALDSFYCHNIVVSLWADAVANRLEGMAIYLLSDELPEVAGHARAAARRLADRIGDLGSAITADPRQPPRPIAGPTSPPPWQGRNPRHDSGTTRALAGGDGSIAGRAGLTPRPCGQQPGAGAGGGDRARDPRTRANPPGAERNDHRRAGTDQVLSGWHAAV
jgi:hypothetical protein